MFGYELLSIVVITIVVILGYLLPWLKNKSANTRWERFINIVSIVVKSVEEIYLRKQIKSKDKNLLEGCDKFEAAYDEIKLLLDQQGLKFSDEAIANAIEAAVLTMRHEEQCKTKCTCGLNKQPSSN